MPSECGNVTLVSARPGTDEVIAGVAAQGLWASSGGSVTWTRIGQGPGSALINNRASSISYDPQHPQTLWESGIYGSSGGAYQSQDGGATFRQLGDLPASDSVSVDLSDPARRTLLSGRHESSALFRSSDGGSTWVDLSSTLPPGVGQTIAPLVINSRVYLLGTKNGSASGIYRTVDSGATWSRVIPVSVTGPPLVTRSGAILWLLDGDRGLIKTTNGGATWQFVSLISSSSGSLIELPNGWLAGIGQYITVSPDRGVTWMAIGSPLPYMASGFTYSPSQRAFYAWHSDCTFTGDTSVHADAIMHLKVDLPAR
jgi:photosystem II stability/assembly factor-like uncharacterized protein